MLGFSVDVTSSDENICGTRRRKKKGGGACFRVKIALSCEKIGGIYGITMAENEASREARLSGEVFEVQVQRLDYSVGDQNGRTN